LGFELPIENGLVGPHGLKIAVGTIEEVPYAVGRMMVTPFRRVAQVCENTSYGKQVVILRKIH